MNPLTLVKRIQKITSTEAALGITEGASWHAKYKESAYVFVGGIPFDLTEGDLLAVFAQYGEVVDVNLVRDKATGKSKGYAFLAYEDQRSTVLAVDNLNGAKILGRIVRVDHVSKYKKKEEEDEEAEQQKREARGVCRAFQRGDCTRGASCKFSHNEQRSANTGWGPQDSNSKWGNDKYEGPSKSQRQITNTPSDWNLDAKVEHKDSKLRSSNEEGQRSRVERDYGDRENHSDDRDRRQFQRRSERPEREEGKRNANEKLLERHKSQLNQIEDQERSEKYSRRNGEAHMEEDRDRQRSVRQPLYDEDESSRFDSRDREMRGSEKQSRHKWSSSRRYREEDDAQHKRERG